MSITQGIDTSYKGTSDSIDISKWLGVTESAGNAFIGLTDPEGAPELITASNIADYGWGDTYDYLSVKYICLFIPLISGDWQFGIPSRDDLGRLRIKYGSDIGISIFDMTDTAYYTAFMCAGKPYWLEARWYELVGTGNFSPRFKYPGDSTARVIQTTTNVCSIKKYNSTVDNTILLSIVL